MTPRRTATYRVDDELIEGMQAVYERDGVQVSEQVRRAIKMWLESKGVQVKSPRKPAATGKRG